MLDLLFSLAMVTGAAAFEPKPCSGPAGSDAKIVCGTVTVPENPSAADKRSIGLNVVILRALAEQPDLPPLFDIDGGPGLAVTRSAAFYATDGLAYRKRRDVVLVDQRGTGGSNPLTCPRLAAPENALSEMYDPALVRECRQSLESKADLTQYGTDAAVRDLDIVRHALGHEKIDIVAISYGTTVALRYMHAHPERVRAAVLMGVAPTEIRPPQYHAIGADQGLDAIFADCAADTACHTAFPDPSGDLVKATAWLKANPGNVAPDVFLEKTRSLLYTPATARRVPLIIHRAAQGDLAPFLALARPKAPMPYADGMYLSITCSESLAVMDYPAAVAKSRKTRFGDYRLRRQKAACAEWPVASVSPAFFKPVSAPTPVLLISGGLDPVTPKAWADKAARSLPNSRHLVIPASGHFFDGLSGIDTCYDPLLLRFFDKPDPQSVDAKCLGEMAPLPFATK